MRFRELRSRIKPLPAFNLNDIRKIDPAFHRQQLTYWLDQHYIEPVAGKYYKLPHTEVNEPYLWMIANRIYAPSYVSLESALAYYQVIPETVLGVTSVSSRKTQRFSSDWGAFRYRSIKPVLMVGYQVVALDENVRYLIARLEKAVLDYLYLNSTVRSAGDFDSLRWNHEPIRRIFAEPRFDQYLGVFNSHALRDRVSALKEYVNA